MSTILVCAFLVVFRIVCSSQSYNNSNVSSDNIDYKNVFILSEDAAITYPMMQDARIKKQWQKQEEDQRDKKDAYKNVGYSKKYMDIHLEKARYSTNFIVEFNAKLNLGTVTGMYKNSNNILFLNDETPSSFFPSSSWSSKWSLDKMM